MKISIIIPCYNEVETIEQIVHSINAIDIQKEIIVIDDGSTDGSCKVLRELKKRNTIQILLIQKKNNGKGAALQLGLKHVTGDYVIIQDADLEYSPTEYHKLLHPLEINVADVVFGSRFIGGESHRILYFWHSIGNKFLTLLSNMLTNLNLTDMEVGYKAFRAEIIKNLRLKEKRFGIEPEITAKIARGNYRIYEVGISYHGRTYNEGKKINWFDGIKAIYYILKYNLWSR